MKSTEFVAKLKHIALDLNTLYVWGAYGAPATAANKERYLNESNAKRATAIKTASSDTYFFDCSGTVKSVLWGFDGNKNARNGGAKYGSNGVPDLGAGELMSVCTNASTDFTTTS